MTYSNNGFSDPRKAAIKSLIDCFENDKYSNLEINSVLNRYEFSDADKRLYTALVYGVIEKKITLDYIISKYSSRPIEKIDTQTLFALRLGIYQLVFMDKIPNYAAVDKCVEITAEKSKGFVNAVLRSFLRNECKYELPKDKNSSTYLSIKYSMPVELTEFFIKNYGFECSDKIFDYFDKKTNEISIRLNTLVDSNSHLNELNNHKISEYLDYVVKTTDTKNAINNIDNGYWFIQDEASAICAEIVNPKQNDLTIDVCAAPGGKSFSMALKMENKGTLISYDLHRNKLSLIESEASKLGITIIQTERRDARKPNELYFEKADNVLCDCPCSGLGVIAKKPEVKYKDLSAIKDLPNIQLDILENSSKYVKLGGTLVYSTCTLNPAENENIINSFLSNNKNFEPVDFEVKNIKSTNGYYTFLPHITNTDGFFISKMKRVK